MIVIKRLIKVNRNYWGKFVWKLNYSALKSFRGQNYLVNFFILPTTLVYHFVKNYNYALLTCGSLSISKLLT